jgi:hypothetical protein
MSSVEDSGITQQTTETSRGERSAREPENEDFVSRRVIEDKILIGFREVLEQALAQEATSPIIDLSPGSHAFVVINYLRPIYSQWQNALRSQKHVSGMLGVQLVPRAVEAKHQPIVHLSRPLRVFICPIGRATRGGAG